MSKGPSGTPPEEVHTAREARQGRRGWIMLLVLFASLSLIIIVFALVYMFADITEDPDATTRNQGPTSPEITTGE